MTMGVLKAPTTRLARRAVRSGPIDAALSVLAAALERASRPGPFALPVLTYHRVDDPARRPDLYPGLISATPDAFEAQVGYLASRYTVLSLEDALGIIRDRRRPPDRSVLITFDDAYRDLLDVAWPVLRAAGLPATVFVPTAFPDQRTGFWWDRLWAALLANSELESRSIDTPVGPLGIGGEPVPAFRAARDLLKAAPHADAVAAVDRVCSELGPPDAEPSVLTWSELGSLAASGLTVAAHTRTHPLLTRIPDAELDDELGGSLEDLRARLGAVLPAVAYPSGAHDARVVGAAERAGYELGFTTVRGGNDVRTSHPLRLRRINVGGATTLSAIRLQLMLLGGRPAREAATG